MDETLVADNWLYDTLTGDATLMGEVTGVHNGQAPQGTSFPYVTYEWLAGSDITYVNAHRVWHSGVWIVKAVAQTSDWTDLQAASARIDVLLHRQSGWPAGYEDVYVDGFVIGRVFSSVRETPFRLDETDEGSRYLHLGGRFRIDVQQA